MVMMAALLERAEPRLIRPLADRWLSSVPVLSGYMNRIGVVAGDPRTASRLLAEDEALLVFPEGHRGFVKAYSQAYRLQRVGTGFVRLALRAGVPIVPVGIVGGEEQYPGLARLETPRWLERRGVPCLPLTWTFPWLGPLGLVPLPVKYRVSFGDPIDLPGDGDTERDVQRGVGLVREAIAKQVDVGLAARRGWFL
jgi:1-acyl-sn-glycerol-3-phosphate acyltransferase